MFYAIKGLLKALVFSIFVREYIFGGFEVKGVRLAFEFIVMESVDLFVCEIVLIGQRFLEIAKVEKIHNGLHFDLVLGLHECCAELSKMIVYYYSLF